MNSSIILSKKEPKNSYKDLETNSGLSSAFFMQMLEYHYVPTSLHRNHQYLQLRLCFLFKKQTQSKDDDT